MILEDTSTTGPQTPRKGYSLYSQFPVLQTGDTSFNEVEPSLARPLNTALEITASSMMSDLARVIQLVQLKYLLRPSSVPVRLKTIGVVAFLADARGCKG